MAALTAVDLGDTSVRELNAALHDAPEGGSWLVARPDGRHNLAVGLTSAIVTVEGNAGVGLAENMMSGVVRVTGTASQAAGATAHGGLLVIEGSAAARCGISMKGVDIVVGCDVGHMSAFMGQAGRLVVCGDAGEALGDSIYEARLFVRGSVASLGADCVEKELRPEHIAELTELLTRAGIVADASEFRRYGSARELYSFHVDNAY
jgi:glutamate synthase domain-containing protein 3